MHFKNNKTKFLIIIILITGQALYGQEIEKEWLACNVYTDTTYVKFENDTVFYKIPGSGTYEEFTGISSYIITGDTIFWMDLPSIVACNPSITGKYTYKISNDELSFEAIDDECLSRLNVLSILQLKAVPPVSTVDPLEKNVKIYPNPVVGNDLFISIEGGEIAKYQYELYDNQGRRMIHGVVVNNESVNLERLESGYYYLIITKEKSRETITYKIQKISN